MTQDNPRLESDRQALLAVKDKGLGAKFATYTKLSGPGWLQSAITLGGGSLAGSLYVGIIGGYDMLWLQPLMMIFGVVMLSAIGYIALSTEKSPFRQINEHINPVLGWGWAIATLMANMVWAMPQFSLGTAAMQQNLGIIPDSSTGQWIGVAILFVVATVVVSCQGGGGKGVKVFELIIKAMVGVVVVSFFAVVAAMALGNEGLPWGEIFGGFVPKPSMLYEPSSTLAPLIAASSAPDYWTDLIVTQQKSVMVAAAATAVGINMTFLLPFSMLKRGWDRNFRGLATFDLSTGLFIPFMLATSCVVLAAASQFHGKPEPFLVDSAVRTEMMTQYKDDASKLKNINGLIASYEKNRNALIANMVGKEAYATLSKDATALAAARANLKESDNKLAATVIKRDASALADSLEKLAGRGIAQYVFGIGVVGMAISTIIILMLINGFTICEMLGQPHKGPLYMIGCLLPGITGALGFIYLWSGEAKFYLAVPTSNFGMVLLPIAYIAFFCMMNSRKILGNELPQGGKRIAINILMLIAVALACVGATVSIFNDQSTVPGSEVRVRDIALGVLGVLLLLGVAVHIRRMKKSDVANREI